MMRASSIAYCSTLLSPAKLNVELLLNFQLCFTSSNLTLFGFLTQPSISFSLLLCVAVFLICFFPPFFDVVQLTSIFIVLTTFNKWDLM